MSGWVSRPLFAAKEERAGGGRGRQLGFIYTDRLLGIYTLERATVISSSFIGEGCARTVCGYTEGGRGMFLAGFHTSRGADDGRFFFALVFLFSFGSSVSVFGVG